MMNRLGPLDSFECAVRFALGVVLVLIAMDYGWTVVGAGAVVLGIVALGTAIVGSSPADRVLARTARK